MTLNGEMALILHYFTEFIFIYYENRTQSTSKKKTNTDRKKGHKNTDTHIKKE